MTIHVLHGQATRQQIEEMLEALESYIKLAVDIRREIAAGGGIFHADCEEALLADGSSQENIWGADWVPTTQEVRYEALINVKPRQDNPTVKLLDEERQRRVAKVLRRLLGGSR